VDIVSHTPPADSRNDQAVAAGPNNDGQLVSDHRPYDVTLIADLELGRVTRVQPCTFFYYDDEPIHFLRLWFGDGVCIEANLGGRNDAFDVLTALILGAQAARDRIRQYAGARVP